MLTIMIDHPRSVSEGSRVAIPYSPGENYEIRVLDFMNAKMSTHEATTILEAPSLFKGPVMTCLPFTGYSRTAPPKLWDPSMAFVLDDERIIAVNKVLSPFSPFSAK